MDPRLTQFKLRTVWKFICSFLPWSKDEIASICYVCIIWYGMEGFGWLTKLVSLSNGLWLTHQARQNSCVRSNKTALTNTVTLLQSFCFCSRWPPGIDLGHTANATCNWRSDTGLHGWRRNKPNTVVVHAAGLDSYLLQQLSGNSTSVEKKRQKQLLIWTENACYLFEAK